MKAYESNGLTFEIKTSKRPGLPLHYVILSAPVRSFVSSLFKTKNDRLFYVETSGVRIPIDFRMVDPFAKLARHLKKGFNGTGETGVKGQRGPLVV